MRVAELYERVINAPSPRGLVVLLAAAAALTVIAAVLFLGGRRRWLAGGLGVLGLALIAVALFVVDAQTVKEKQSDQITVIWPRYSERTRLLALTTMIGLEALAVVVVLGAWVWHRRQLRAQVPHHLKAARRYFMQKEYDAALAEYNQALQVAPYLGEGYCGRARVYQALGETARALADLDRAIESDPQLAAAYLHRGKIRTETDDLDGAMDDFGKLLFIQADDPEFYLSRGICLVKKGLVHEAIADFHRVLKLTNHSDFADPAKNYLDQFEGQGQPPVPAPSANGTTVSTPDTTPSPSVARPRTEDYSI